MSLYAGATTASVERHRAWLIAGISIFVLILLVLMLYLQSVLYLTGLWGQYDTGNYAHGYLVLAISVFLIVSSRHELALMTPCPSALALPFVLLASLLWLVAVLVDVNMIQTVALLLLLLAVVWSVMGGQVTGKLMFPLLFIAFAIPIWFPLSPVLQDLTADVVFRVVRFIGIPAARQENNILLPAGIFSIEEACSGLRYLLTALTLGSLYAYLNYQTLRARIIVVFVAAMAGVLANMVRVFVVVYLGYKTDMQHPYVNDHLMLGWYLFGALVIALLFIDAFLHKYFRRRGSEVEVGESIAQHTISESAACAKGQLHQTVIMLACVLMLIAGPAAAYFAKNQAGDNNEQLDIAIPESVADWKRIDISDSWMPVYHGAASRQKVYSRNADKIVLYIGCYVAQQQGEELINELNRISNEAVWKRAYPRARLRNAVKHPVLEQLLEANTGERRLVWYWYRVAERTTTSEYEAKLLQLLGLITGKKQACVTAISTDFGENPDIARSRLAEFAVETGPIEHGISD